MRGGDGIILTYLCRWLTHTMQQSAPWAKHHSTFRVSPECWALWPMTGCPHPHVNMPCSVYRPGRERNTELVPSEARPCVTMDHRRNRDSISGNNSGCRCADKSPSANGPISRLF